MKQKRMYYPKTTYSQRQRLFQVWEETQDVREACRQARVSVNMFYYWKPRFEAGGYEALKELKRPGPSKGMWTDEGTQEAVRQMKRAHPEWGKQRIADEMAKANSWVPVVSANTVRRILQEAGLWERVAEGDKKKGSSR
jgi:transposase